MKKHTKFIMLMISLMLIATVGLVGWMLRKNTGVVGEQISIQEDNIGIADHWTSMRCELDGVIYQLPCTYKEMAKNGWEFAAQEEDIPGVGERDNEIFKVELRKDNCTIIVQLYHSNSEATAVEECDIIAVLVSDNSGVEFEVAKGINFDSTEEEIEDVFGICKTRLFVNSNEFRTIEYYNGTARQGSLVFTYSKQDNGDWIETIALCSGYIR